MESTGKEGQKALDPLISEVRVTREGKVGEDEGVGLEFKVTVDEGPEFVVMLSD